MKMLKNVAALGELTQYCFSPRGRMLGFYYDQVPNVGDQLNIDLAAHIFDRELTMISGMRFVTHVLMVGSILGQMNKNSVVWGSGVLSPEIFAKCSGLGDIRAVRGELTRSLIQEKFNVELNCPLGDPGLLMPQIYAGSTGPREGVAIVPHLLDENSEWVASMVAQGARLVSVRLPPEEFIKQLTQAEAVISSSLHGLILADAYGLPNIRFSLPSEIPGGDFKFNDYYSTTDAPEANSATLRIVEGDRRQLEHWVEQVFVKPYRGDLAKLRACAPTDVV